MWLDRWNVCYKHKPIPLAARFYVLSFTGTWGFESHQQHGFLSLVVVVCCQVEVSATDRSPIQRSATDCGMSECDREACIIRKPWPTGGHMAEEIWGKYCVTYTLEMTLFANI